MGRPYFRFKQFTVYQDACAMKVTTDACLFGAWCAREIKSSKVKIQRALDIGTGTGLLSLMVAQQNNICIEAVELEPAAAAQAGSNIAASPWKGHIRLHHMDILSFQPATNYDAIISNPPFYENEVTAADAKKNIAHHSAHLNLESLLVFIKKHLSITGSFYLLLPYKRKSAITALLKKHELFIHQQVAVRQSAHHDYFRMLIAGGPQPAENVLEYELSIWGEHQQYTPDFVALLKDYYLYL